MFRGIIEDDTNAEKKTITIRGVDKQLYDLFSSLSGFLGQNIGTAMSIMISTYERDGHPLSLPMKIHKVLFRKIHDKSIEVIRDIPQLVISKEDLTAAGTDVQYAFRNIDNLTFDKTVDNTIFLKYVHRISQCNVKAKGDISRLYLASIRHSSSSQIPLSGDFKDVTIRNVNSAIYDEFVAKCHKNKITIGDALNFIFQTYIPRFEVMHILTHEAIHDASDIIVISLRPSIHVTKKDLLDLEERKVMFHRIDNLQFSDEIENTLFIEKVRGIYSCPDIKLPNSLPKLITLSRIKTSFR